MRGKAWLNPFWEHITWKLFAVWDWTWGRGCRGCIWWRCLTVGRRGCPSRCPTSPRRRRWCCTCGTHSQIPGTRVDSHENNIAKQDPGEIYFGNTVLCVETITVKKLPVPFPAPSWDVTYQTLSSREYVSLMKTGVFPDIFFPSHEFKGAEFFSQRPNFMATRPAL